MKKLLLLLSLLCISVYAAVLTENGEAKAEIILPEDPIGVEQRSADELVKHIQLISGALIPVRKGAPSGTALPIFIGRASDLDIANIPVNGAIVRITEDRIDIAGTDGAGDAMDGRTPSGTLFGTYDFLEKMLGVRWLWPGNTGIRIIRNDNIQLDSAEWQSEAPIITGWRHGINAKAWITERNAAAFFRAEREWLRRHRFNWVENYGYGHAYTDYWRRFGETHPEYFNLLPDGKRYSDKTYVGAGAPSLIAMCITNEGFINQVIEDWKQNPNNLINANENDTPGKCVCDACIAADESDDPTRVERARELFMKKDPNWVKPLGSLTDRYCKFYMTLLKKGREINPDCRVIGDIYANYADPPRPGTILDDHIVLRFCPAIAYPWTEQKIANFKKWWKEWRDTGVKLMFRPNFTLDGANMPLLYYRAFVECFDFARKDGMICTDMDSLTGMYGANGLTDYIIASKNGSGVWKSVEELEDDYFSAFGPAEPKLRKCMKALEILTAEGEKKAPVADNLVGNDVNFTERLDIYYPPEELQKALDVLKEAAEVAKGNEDATAKVHFVTLGIYDAYLSSCISREMREAKKTGNFQKVAGFLHEQQEFRRENEKYLYANTAYNTGWEKRKLPVFLAKIGATGYEIKGWSIQFDPLNKGVEKEWFKQPKDDKWTDVTLTNHWEKLPVGQAWEKEHGTPFKGVAWYRTDLKLENWDPKHPAKLTFGAVDGDAQVYIDGELVMAHHPFLGNGESWIMDFELDVTGKVHEGINSIVVRVEKGPIGVSGIWKPVYFVPEPLSVIPSTNPLEGGWGYNTFTPDVIPEGDCFPMTLTCTAPKQGVDFNGVWARFIKAVPVKQGKSYKFTAKYRTTDKAEGSFWFRDAAVFNLPGPSTKGEVKGVSRNFTAATGSVTLYFTIVNGIGTFQILDATLEEAPDANPLEGGWKLHTPMSGIVAKGESFPMTLTCSAPQEGVDFKGVWARFHKTIPVEIGKNYEFKMKYRTTDQAEASVWFRGAATFNLWGHPTKGAVKELAKTFTAEKDSLTLYLTLVNGVGTLEILDVTLNEVK